MSQFAFLQREWAAVFEAASKAEGAVHVDPRTACSYARRALELAVGWTYECDPGLELANPDTLSALIHESSFKQFVVRPVGLNFFPWPSVLGPVNN
ncbi:MAG: hypothetical protein KGJ55_11135 [Gammaproteobacteria bacterium]|nr:hypothetical protein [Gammaproteobacteria bacterium]